MMIMKILVIMTTKQINFHKNCLDLLDLFLNRKMVMEIETGNLHARESVEGVTLRFDLYRLLSGVEFNGVSKRG